MEVVSVMGSSLRGDGDKTEAGAGGGADGVTEVVTEAISSIAGVAKVGTVTVTVLLGLAVFADFDCCFDDFLAIFVRLYSFVPLS
jgi:hypothetical protein